MQENEIVEDVPFEVDLEIFEMTRRDILDLPLEDRKFYADGPGWYWWVCSPGCLPESDPWGPFASKRAAERNIERTGAE